MPASPPREATIDCSACKWKKEQAVLKYFSLPPSAPLTHKYALRKLPQLHSLPLKRQKNRGTAVPAHIRMQTSSVRLAAIPHLKAPRYSLISLQLKKKWYRAICHPLNAISRLKPHFTSNTWLKHWLHPAFTDDRTYTVFPLQSSRRLGAEQQDEPCARSGHSAQSTNPAAGCSCHSGGKGKPTSGTPARAMVGREPPLCQVTAPRGRRNHRSPGSTSRKRSRGQATCRFGYCAADFCYRSPFCGVHETTYSPTSVSTTIWWKRSTGVVKSSKVRCRHKLLFQFSSQIIFFTADWQAQ